MLVSAKASAPLQLIGVAASTVTTDATIATATVLAIAIIAVALVRVTT